MVKNSTSSLFTVEQTDQKSAANNINKMKAKSPFVGQSRALHFKNSQDRPSDFYEKGNHI